MFLISAILFCDSSVPAFFSLCDFLSSIVLCLLRFHLYSCCDFDSCHFICSTLAISFVLFFCDYFSLLRFHLYSCCEICSTLAFSFVLFFDTQISFASINQGIAILCIAIISAIFYLRLFFLSILRICSLIHEFSFYFLRFFLVSINQGIPSFFSFAIS